MELHLPYRPPLDAPGLLAFLGARAVPGVEELTPDGTYRRTLRLPSGAAVLELACIPDAPAFRARVVALRQADDEPQGVGGHVRPVALSKRDPIAPAGAAARHLLDLDADPAQIDAVLTADPLLAPLIARRPGLRCPGHVDPTELATRAILGQQVSVERARLLATRLVEAHGTPLAKPDGTLTHLFPDATTIASLPSIEFAMPRARSAALAATTAAIAAGTLDLRPGADPEAARSGLLAIKGIGPWTAGYIAMRALGDPDAWLPTDIGVRHGLARIGAGPERAERWRPYRSYALMHLWAALADPAT